MRKRSFRPSVEVLEDRVVPYALSGSVWANTNISASFVPDGTTWFNNEISALFVQMNTVAPTATWQREFARALQSWADVSNLNFHFVSDDGSALGIAGSGQGDSRFGDIRLGAVPMGALGYTIYPNNYTSGGDITLDAGTTFSIGANTDLYSVLLHESGHALGLAHSDLTTAVMYPIYQGVSSGLSADDIAGVQAMYGARQSDSFDALAANDSLASASSLDLSSGSKTFNADLSNLTDLDYYRVVVPTGSDGTLTVSMDARTISLLTPSVEVYDAAGALVGSASASTYGSVATVSLSGLVAGQTYYVLAKGATTDVFGMGAYRMSLQFGGTFSAPTSSVQADRYEADNTAATAASLGTVSSLNQTGLTFHTATDVDYYAFVAKTSATYNVSITSQTAAGVSLSVLNSQQTVLTTGQTQTGSATLTVSLTSGQKYFIKALSPTGSLLTYNLAMAKASTGGSAGKANKGGALTGDAYGAPDALGAALEGPAFARLEHALSVTASHAVEPHGSESTVSATVTEQHGSEVAAFDAVPGGVPPYRKDLDAAIWSWLDDFGEPGLG